MDNYLNRNSVNNQYFLAMAQAASFDLIKTARIVSARHINDLFLKAKFEDEIRRFSNGNLDIVRNASSSSECQVAINNIKEECANIEKQGTMLSLEKAKVFITINMEKREKELGYTINAIGVIRWWCPVCFWSWCYCWCNNVYWEVCWCTHCFQWCKFIHRKFFPSYWE
ncbi:DUF4225 domain-containing protein [Pectobacterium zantedeschiae]|uniref:DUF4225 domain-containing protein n=1 Tax=Pectobacterium zantedeschiae TaxID=2034769 RepID=UPI003754EE57